MVTGVPPEVSGEQKTAGVHYVETENHRDIPALCEELLGSGEWRGIAAAGHELVMKNHTWATRAKELRGLLRERLGV